MSFCLTFAPSPDWDSDIENEDCDLFCGLTGGGCIECGDVYTSKIIDAWLGLPYEARLTIFHPSLEILKELIIPEDDTVASVDLVLLAPVRPDDKFEAEMNEDMAEHEVPKRGSIGTFAMNLGIAENVAPSGSHFFRCEKERFVGNLRTLHDSQSETALEAFEDEDYADLSTMSNKYGVRLDMFRILLGRFPEIEPHMLYHAIALDPCENEPDWEDCNTRGQWGSWLNVADVDEDEDEDAESFWLRLVSRTDMTKEEIVKEAWMGRGRMYRHLRVDRFPHADPLPALEPGSKTSPFARFTLDLFFYFCENFLECHDVAVLAVLDKATRAFILPHIDRISENSIRHYEPHLLPIGTTAYDRGMEEFDEWERVWTGKPIPWCAYAQECRRSPHMKNRARFWRIAGRTRELIGNMGMLAAIS